MSVTFPENTVSGWPDSDAEVEVTRDPSPALLLAIAGSYHSAQFMLATRTTRLSRDLWAQMRPVDDTGLAQWVTQWDSLLASAAQQQSRLTESYMRMSLRAFGVDQQPLVEVDPPDPGRAANVERWLESDYADLDEGLHDEAEALLARLRGNQATLGDLARADRLPWLHSPVIRGRTGLSQGLDPDLALGAVEPSLDVSVDAALRTQESDVLGNIGWPRFANGKAMMAKRVPSAGACGWCRVVATRLYSLDSMKRDKAWHHACRCDMVLVTEREAKAYTSVLASTTGEGGSYAAEGNYYKAARAIGLWDGPVERGSYAGVIGDRFDPSAAAAAGFISRRSTRGGVVEVYDPASGEYRAEQGAQG